MGKKGKKEVDEEGFVTIKKEDRRSDKKEDRRSDKKEDRRSDKKENWNSDSYRRAYIHPTNEPILSDEQKKRIVDIVIKRTQAYWRDLTMLELDKAVTIPIMIKHEHIRYASSYEDAVKAYKKLMEVLNRNVRFVLDAFGGIGNETNAFLWASESSEPITVHVTQGKDPIGLFQNRNTTFECMQANILAFTNTLPEICENKKVFCHNMNCSEFLRQKNLKSGAWDVLVLDCPWEKPDENGVFHTVSRERRRQATADYASALARGDDPIEAEHKWLEDLNEMNPHELLAYINHEVFAALDQANMTFKCLLIKCRFGNQLMRNLLNSMHKHYDLVYVLEAKPFVTPYYYHILKNKVQEIVYYNPSDLHVKNFHREQLQNAGILTDCKKLSQHDESMRPGYARSGASGEKRVVTDGTTDYESFDNTINAL